MIATAASLAAHDSLPSASPLLPLPPSPPRVRTRRPWTPCDRDHLIFQWVKLEGENQTWVGQQFKISQSTVSRIVQRYERWQAHAQPGEDGRLVHAERLRAQRWLTYERNEVVLASALRIAGAMEGVTTHSKSIFLCPADRPAEDQRVRTESASIDRSGVAARFLRLAFRINMEQLKLIEREPLDPLPPLYDDDIDNTFEGSEDRSFLATLAKSASAGNQRASEGDPAGTSVERSPLTPSETATTDDSDLATTLPFADALDDSPTPLPVASEDNSHPPETTDEPSPPTPVTTAPNDSHPPTSPTHHSLTHDSHASLHNLHNTYPTEFVATDGQPCLCMTGDHDEKTTRIQCMRDADNLESPDRHRPIHTDRCPTAVTVS